MAGLALALLLTPVALLLVVVLCACALSGRLDRGEALARGYLVNGG